MGGGTRLRLARNEGVVGRASMNLTVLICTHNRAELLERTLASLNAATRPADCHIDILVVANACTDGTAALLTSYGAARRVKNNLPLRWLAEPRPGKSYALNSAIPTIPPTWLHSSTMTTESTKGTWLASRAPRRRIPTRRCSAVESFLTGTAASHRGCMIPGLTASIRSPSPAQISGPRRRSCRLTGRCCLAAAIYSFDVRCSTVSAASR